jgi:nucleoside-diphosphate-sugar epimerase
MRVIITGAAGRIGSELVDELTRSHELCLIDIRRIPGRKTVTADLSRVHRSPFNRLNPFYKSWSVVFEGAEAVVHLAANRQSLAPWEKVLPDNIQATWNVIEAAARCGVPRVVFASSNWAVKALEKKLAPACYRFNGPKITSDASPYPVNDYGISKALGELTGQMFVDEQKLKSFVAVRIGNFNAVPSKDKILRTRWIGVRDIRALFRRCVEADFEGYHVVYGVSAQPTAPYDLSHTCDLLSWKPLQTA